MKRFWIFCSVAVVLGGGSLGVWKLWGNRADAPKFRTAPAGRGDIISIVNASGTVNPLVRVDLGSQVSGIVRALHVDFNDPVAAGQLVAEIDPATYIAQVTQAEANLARTRADLSLSRQELQRVRKLVENGAAARSDLETAQARYEMVLADEKHAAANLDLAQSNLRNTKIYSPIDGIVIDRKVEVGQTVAAGLNVTVLYTIANSLDQMQINTLVDESDIGRVAEGQDVEFTVDSYPRAVFRGTVHQVRNAAIVKQDVVNYDAVVRVENPERKLKPGMTANVSIIVNHRKNVLRVPNAALRFKPPEADPPAAATGSPWGSARPSARRPRSEERVYVLSAGSKPERVSVEIGAQDDSFTEILSGLTEGQQVVVGLEYSKRALAQAQQLNPWQMRRF